MKCPVPECGEEMTVWYAAGKMNVARCSRNHEFPPDLLEAGRITIAPLPKPEPWRPRTHREIIEDLRPSVNFRDCIQARTNDLIRVLEEEAERATKVDHAYYASPALHKMARRFRELE